ncbi:uncharacterized protein rab44 isoform X1 [Neoarius graeffei]|uniref:uncharacterized protein rab44 isoform X1 n=1 Tax=Neoarius graeffei TaxID=443677 RepID=UPI00298BEB93|nr:uncharacterized protein rab44 isoform X1 [Neoarius graeffei]
MSYDEEEKYREIRTEREVEKDEMQSTTSDQLLFSKASSTNMLDFVTESGLIPVETLYGETETNSQTHNLQHNNPGEFPTELEMQSKEGVCSDQMLDKVIKYKSEFLDTETKVIEEDNDDIEENINAGSTEGFTKEELIRMDDDKDGMPTLMNEHEMASVIINVQDYAFPDQAAMIVKEHGIESPDVGSDSLGHAYPTSDPVKLIPETQVKLDMQVYNATAVPDQKQNMSEECLVNPTNRESEAEQFKSTSPIVYIQESRLGQDDVVAENVRLSPSEEKQFDSTGLISGGDQKDSFKTMKEAMQVQSLEKSTPISEDGTLSFTPETCYPQSSESQNFMEPEAEKIDENMIKTVTENEKTNTSQEYNETPQHISTGVVNTNQECNVLDREDEETVMVQNICGGVDTTHLVLSDVAEQLLDTEVFKMQSRSEVAESIVQNEQATWDGHSDSQTISLEDPHQNTSPHLKLGQSKSSEYTELVTVTINTDHLMTSAEPMDAAGVAQQPGANILQATTTPIQEEAHTLNSTNSSRDKMGSICRALGEKDEEEDMYGEEQDVAFRGRAMLLSPENGVSKEEKNDKREEINAGLTENSTVEDLAKCSQQYMYSELSSQTTIEHPSPATEHPDIKEDDGNSIENVENRSAEIHLQTQTKKKKKFGSTRRSHGRHQPNAEGEEGELKDLENTPENGHQIITKAATSNLLTEPQNAMSEGSLDIHDSPETDEQKQMTKSEVEFVSEVIDAPPAILSNEVDLIHSVVSDDVSNAEGLTDMMAQNEAEPINIKEKENMQEQNMDQKGTNSEDIEEEIPDAKEEINTGSIEKFTTTEDITTVCSHQYMYSELSSQTTIEHPSPATEHPDIKEDDGNSIENVENRNAEIHLQTQTKKKKKFGSTRRLHGRHQPHAEGEEGEWKDLENTQEIGNQITTEAATSNLLTDPQNAMSEGSHNVHDSPETDEQKQKIKSEVEFISGVIDAPPAILSNEVDLIHSVVSDDVSNAEGLTNMIEQNETEPINIKEKENMQEQNMDQKGTNSEDIEEEIHDTKEEINTGPTEKFTTTEDIATVCSLQYMYSELSSQTTREHPSPTTEHPDIKEDDGNSIENVENRNAEIHLQTQTKKKKKFGSTRRLHGRHQPNAEGEGKDLENTPESGHQIITKAATSSLLTESQNAMNEGSLDIHDSPETDEQKQMTKSEVEFVSAVIDALPAILSNELDQVHSVVSDDISNAEGLTDMIEQNEVEPINIKEKENMQEQNMDQKGTNTEVTDEGINDTKEEINAGPTEKYTTTDDITTVCSQQYTLCELSSQATDLGLTTIEHPSPATEHSDFKEDDGDSIENVENRNAEIHLQTQTKKKKFGSTRRLHGRHQPHTEGEEGELKDLENTPESGHQIITKAATSNLLTEPQNAMSEGSLDIHDSPETDEQKQTIKSEVEFVSEVTDAPPAILSNEVDLIHSVVSDDDSNAEGLTDMMAQNEAEPINIKEKENMQEQNMDQKGTNSEDIEEEIPDAKEEINTGSTEKFTTTEDITTVCSHQYMYSELSSQTTIEHPSHATEHPDIKEDDGNSIENVENRSAEIHLQTQTKKKKKFGSTRRSHGRHQPHAEGEEGEWKDPENTQEIGNQITTEAATSNLLTEPQNAMGEGSLNVHDSPETDEQKQKIKSEVEFVSGVIDAPPVILSNEVDPIHSVVSDDVSNAEGLTNMIQQNETEPINIKEKENMQEQNMDQKGTNTEVTDEGTNDTKKEINAGPTEKFTTTEDITTVCSQQYTLCELSSQATDLGLTTIEHLSPATEHSDFNENDGNSIENVENRNAEIHLQTQTKKKKKFGSTRRLHGRHQPNAEGQEGEWKDLENTPESGHQITTEAATSNLLTEPQNAMSEASLDIHDSPETDEQKQMTKSEAEFVSAVIDAPPTILSNEVDQVHSVVSDDISNAEGLTDMMEQNEVEPINIKEKENMQEQNMDQKGTNTEVTDEGTNDTKEEINAGPTEKFTTTDDITTVCSQQYTLCELSSQATDPGLTTIEHPSPATEHSDFKEDDGNSIENVENRNAEIHLQTQTKKKKFGSTRRLHGRHQPHAEEEKGELKDLENTQKIQVIDQTASINLLTEPQNGISELSLDILEPTLSTEQDMECTENESASQVAYPTHGPVEVIHEIQGRSDIPNVYEYCNMLSEEHLENPENRESKSEECESTCPALHIQELKLAPDDKVTQNSGHSGNSGRRKKIGSTRRSLRVIKEKENTQEETTEESTPTSDKDHAQKGTFNITTEISHQSIQTPSEPLNIVDPEAEKIGSTCNNLEEGQSKQEAWQNTKDTNPRYAGDIDREYLKLVEKEVVNPDSDICGAKTRVQEYEPQIHRKLVQSEGSLLSEIEFYLNKSFEGTLKTTILNPDIAELSEPISEESLQLPSSQNPQIDMQPSSPARRRKMGSNRKMSRNMHAKKISNEGRGSEQEKENLDNAKNSEPKREAKTVKESVMTEGTEDMKESVELVSEVQVLPRINDSSKQSTGQPLPECRRKFGSRRSAKGSSGLGAFTHGDYESDLKKTDVQVTNDDLRVSDAYLTSESESTPISHPVSEPRPGIEEVRTTVVKDTNAPCVVSTRGRPKIDSEQWNEQLPDFGQAVYNVVMVGNSNVGKTSFIKRLQSGHFITDYNATIGVDTFVQTVTFGSRTVKLYVWDTAGQERYHSITRQVFHKAQGLLLMYDITSSQSFHAVRAWISQVQEKASPDVILMLLGNKNDCVNREVQLQEGEDLSKEYNIHFMECSAATGENVSESLKTLAWLLVKQKVRKEEEHTTLQPKPQNKKSGCC